MCCDMRDCRQTIQLQINECGIVCVHQLFWIGIYHQGVIIIGTTVFTTSCVNYTFSVFSSTKSQNWKTHKKKICFHLVQFLFFFGLSALAINTSSLSSSSPFLQCPELYGCIISPSYLSGDCTELCSTLRSYGYPQNKLKF